jgi:chromosome segregation ATPase
VWNRQAAVGFANISQRENCQMVEQHDPEETLKQLKNDLQSKENEVTQKTSEREVLKGKIASLDKVVNELKPIMSTYGQALPNLQKDRDDIEKYLDAKIPMIYAAVKDKKEDIDDKINEYDKNLREKNEKLKEIKDKHDRYNEAYQYAQGRSQDKQEEYDEKKSYQKNISGKIEDLKNLRKEIGQEGEKSNAASMYFLSEEMKSILEETEIISQDNLRNTLFNASNELYIANEDLRVKKDDLERTKKELETTQNELKSLESNRRKEILERISGFNPSKT